MLVYERIIYQANTASSEPLLSLIDFRGYSVLLEDPKLYILGPFSLSNKGFEIKVKRVNTRALLWLFQSRKRLSHLCCVRFGENAATFLLPQFWRSALTLTLYFITIY